MKYQVGDLVKIKHKGKLGIVISSGHYESADVGEAYHVLICGIPNQTYYYYEHEIEKLK